MSSENILLIDLKENINFLQLQGQYSDFVVTLIPQVQPKEKHCDQYYMHCTFYLISLPNCWKTSAIAYLFITQPAGSPFYPLRYFKLLGNVFKTQGQQSSAGCLMFQFTNVSILH